MKKILGLDVGTVTFTPGGAGVGTLVFAGITGFNASRLLAVSNVTRKALIYAVEVTGKGGAWSSLSTTGGTLTLDFDTTGHNAADVLRCEYQEADPLLLTPGRNLAKPLSAWSISGGVTRTLDYGPGPLPGTRSVRLQTAGTVAAATFMSVSASGRGDGVRMVFSVWMKSPSASQVQLAVPASSANASTAASEPQSFTLTSTWTRYRGYLTFPQSDVSSFALWINATGAIDVEVACPDFRQAQDLVPGPYEEPTIDSLPSVILQPTQSTTVAAWGDSLTDKSLDNSNWRDELSRLLNGAYIYNGGVSGETSTQVKTRMLAAANTWRHFGITTIWVGRNNISSWANPATIVTDVAAMVAVLQHGRFLVLSVTNSTAEPLGSDNYNRIAEVNALIASVYGPRFVDVRSPLCAGTDTDIPNATLMYDAIHMTWAGYGVVAQEIYKAAARMGYLPWVDPPPIPVYDARVCSAKFTRPANTTAYASGDLIGQSVVNTDVHPMSFPLPPGYALRRLRLMKSGVSTTAADFRIHLYQSLPAPVNGDNAAWSTAESHYIGYVDVTTSQVFTDGAKGWGTFAGVVARKDRGGLWALLEARAAYTPESGETFTVTVEYGV